MNFSPLMAQMTTAEFYPHTVELPIEIIQTHISTVFLTGPYAYKVKKPVNFGFLDFSTLEKRQHFCGEELRLNQRLSPDLYLDVLPIYRHNDIYSFRDEGGEVVEYVVKMVQFPQENLLIHLFEKNLLTLEQVQAIGTQLAQFHQRAANNQQINQFGTALAMESVAEDNYRHTEAYIGRGQTQAQFDHTRAYTEAYFRHHADRFEQRIAAGKIRECHGDLHLKNICLWQDKIRIFDCIEFNEPFRHSDVLYDAAFLFMDLEFRGRSDLANGFLNTYLETTGDYEGVTLLPLYCSMRAYIRAKVTSFLLDDAAIPDAVKTAAQAEAAAYYQLAYRYTVPQSGKILIMSGLSGSGKSTLARAVAQKLRAIHIRSDAIRKHLGGIDLYTPGDDSLYSAEMTAKTYERLQTLGVSLAQAGFTVILDAKYDRYHFRSAVKAAAGDIPCQILYCHAEMQTLHDRVEKRSSARLDVADATPSLLASQQEQFEGFTAAELAYVVDFNTDLSIDLSPILS